MGPGPAYGGGYDSEDEEIPCYFHRSGRKRHGSVRVSGRSPILAYDGDDEASEYTGPSRADRDTRPLSSPRGSADDCRESRRSRGERSSSSRGRADNDEVLYYAKYRNPAKDLPIERDPEGIDMCKVRQHTRPSRPRESSGYRESYKVQVDEYEDDLPTRTCTGRRDSAQPETYKVQVDEYENGLPPRPRTHRRGSPQPGRFSRSADDLKPGELPPRSRSHGFSRPSPVVENVQYEIREPRGYRSSLYFADVGLEPDEHSPRSGQRGSSRPARIDEAVEYEIREPRGYRASQAACEGFYQNHSSMHIGIMSHRPHGTRAAGCRCESASGGHGRG
ncbi:hypothetical protein BDV11DRAFT_171481 [Aspergillus similis]